ncbi:MAG TPA: extracellular solute-binding protein [Nocardioidaceae bacterium]|nr:extracellular solute-binding protein [Nocardioidaceae bacterium]
MIASAALLVAGCSGGGAGQGGTGGQGSSTKKVSQSAIDKAMSTPTTLTFWTWVPKIQNEVKLFEQKYPKISVKVVNVGQGADQYRKLRTVLKAGKGAPDVVQIEYQYLSSFVLGDNLLDLAPYGADKIKSQYQEWIWSQVSRNGAVYGIPQDTGPMGLLYRKDLLEKAGIQPPATWDAFAKASVAYHKKNPNSYLTDLPGNDPGEFIGLLWQNGARPFSYDGQKTVSIELDSPKVTKVSDYWTKLIGTGSVATDPDFTDAWYQGLAKGKYASWLTAAWGPVFLQGTAKNTSGLWRATKLPQYPGSQEASGNWGGSTDAVVKGTQHEIAAAQLAMWINTNHESALQLATKQFLFPSSSKVLQDPTFLNQKSDFYGGQQVNKEFADINKTVSKDFGWLPFTDYVYSSFNETVGKAIADRGDVTAAVKTWQGKLVTYAKQQGFTVK